MCQPNTPVPRGSSPAPTVAKKLSPPRLACPVSRPSIIAETAPVTRSASASRGDGGVKAALPAPRIEFEQPITIRYGRFDEFVREVSESLSISGMFIQTQQPRPCGSTFDFTFQLGDDFDLVQGRVEVVWTRRRAEGKDRPVGMGVKFLSLDAASNRTLKRIIEGGHRQECDEHDRGVGRAEKLATKGDELEQVPQEHRLPQPRSSYAHLAADPVRQAADRISGEIKVAFFHFCDLNRKELGT